MEAIGCLAVEHGLFVVEDAAHATGSLYGSIRIGAGTSDAVAFSFYATKNLSTGEGGMVTCRDPNLRERMRVLSLHGISHDAWERQGAKDTWDYDVVECGFKYNMSDISAAIGLVQLTRIDEMNARRAAIAHAYNEAFAGMARLELPPDSSIATHAWQLYILRLNLDRLRVDRSQFIAEMRRRGIGCSVHFKPIPMHPYYRDRLELRDPCARAINEYPRLVSLPLSSRLSDAEVARVIAAVEDICG
jgi:dTDP-4-amino-4,6-dideoxygalactose transaminase